ncbi:MAG: hypothetical protein IRY99_07460 [Isosphaeraceae bacterium]|nr:hypothetical protein [Isosphaeraceae bacterium]
MCQVHRRILVAAVLAAGAGIGAAPAAPSFSGVQQVIEQIRADWQKRGENAPKQAPGWNAYFDALLAELRNYETARTETDKIRSLDRLYRFYVALKGHSWKPAVALQLELRNWLRPRVALAWAVRRLEEAVRGLPPTPDPTTRAHREGWLHFVDEGLGKALRDYEAARTVVQRREALKRVYGALHAINQRIAARPWTPSMTLKAALDDLFNRPNLDASVDANTLALRLRNNVVESGPVLFKGQLSYVTAGPHVGYGLLPSDDGIAFYNSQLLTSVTPISGFHQQVQQNPRGRRAARMYYFGATSTDQSQLTIIGIIRDTGLELLPAYLHNVSAVVSSTPIPGRGLGRFVAALIGYNQRRITREVYQGAIGQIQQGVVQGAAELGAIRTSQEAAKRNVELRQNLVGNHTLLYRNLEITNLKLRSRPENAMIGGIVRWLNAAEQVGADTPKPGHFSVYDAGVSADVHLPSIMTNLARGYLQSDLAKKVENLMVVTRKIPPGAPPSEGFVLTQNADFETFAKAVEETRAANDPKVLAIRVKRPGQAPEFAADARGFLVVLVHDFLIEVPAPPAAARGGLFGPAARIYRLTAPNAEFVLSYTFYPAKGQLPIRLSGRIEEFDPGPGAQVYAIDESEEKAVPLTAFTRTIVLNTFGNRLKGQPIDIPLSQIRLPNLELTSISPLDPSGWIRIIMTPR